MHKTSHQLPRIYVGYIVVVLFFVMMGSVVAEEWNVISELPTRRRNFSTAVVEGKIYLIGGTPFENRRGPYGLSTVEVYDPKTNTWERLADMPTPRTRAGAAVVDEIIYVFGGRGENWEQFTSVVAFGTGFHAVMARNKLATRWGELK